MCYFSAYLKKVSMKIVLHPMLLPQVLKKMCRKHELDSLMTPSSVFSVLSQGSCAPTSPFLPQPKSSGCHVDRWLIACKQIPQIEARKSEFSPGWARILATQRLGWCHNFRILHPKMSLLLSYILYGREKNEQRWTRATNHEYLHSKWPRRHTRMALAEQTWFGKEKIS